MTIFESRDFAPAAPPVLPPGPADAWHETAPGASLPPPAPTPLPAPAAVPTPTSFPAPAVLPSPEDVRRVVIRVRGGEEIEVGRTEGRDPALALAREAIRLVEEADAEGEWPAVGDRFVRPEAIVSIDVQRATA